MHPGLDPAIHAPARLAIVALLAATTEVEFALVRDQVGVSDSVLSKHAAALEAAGYLHIRKGYVGRRPRTWLSLTEAGRTAFAGHVSALNRIVSQAGATIEAPPVRQTP
jgi:DNA-binding MarR family transcriptional regulator